MLKATERRMGADREREYLCHVGVYVCACLSVQVK